MAKKDFEFRLFDYGTYYGTRGDCYVEEDWHCCFGDFTKEYDTSIYSQKFSITLWKLRSKAMTEEGHNNVCLLNVNGIKKHLEEIQQIHEFKYEVVPYCDKYVIHIDIKAHSLYIKFILTWIRLLYEFPHNVLYCEALKLRKFPEFSDMNILSIYNLVCSTMRNTIAVGSEEGFIYTTRFTEPITYKELQERIEHSIETGNYWINFLFDITENEGSALLPNIGYWGYSDEVSDIIYGDIPESKCPEEYKKYYNQSDSANVFYFPRAKDRKFKRYKTTLDAFIYNYWTSVGEFSKRLKAYKSNLTILKNYLKAKK